MREITIQYLLHTIKLNISYVNKIAKKSLLATQKTQIRKSSIKMTQQGPDGSGEVEACIRVVQPTVV